MRRETLLPRLNRVLLAPTTSSIGIDAGVERAGCIVQILRVMLEMKSHPIASDDQILVATRTGELMNAIQLSSGLRATELGRVEPFARE